MSIFSGIGSAISDAGEFLAEDVQPIAEDVSEFTGTIAGTTVQRRRSDGRIETTVSSPEPGSIGVQAEGLLSNPLVLIGAGLLIAKVI